MPAKKKTEEAEAASTAKTTAKKTTAKKAAKTEEKLPAAKKASVKKETVQQTEEAPVTTEAPKPAAKPSAPKRRPAIMKHKREADSLNDPNLTRAFIAVKLPEAISLKIDEFLTDIKPMAPRYRWVKPNIYHITLKFLGELPHDTIQKIIDIIKPRRKLPPFTINLNRAGAFPGLIYMAGNAGKNELTILSTRINQLLKKTVGLPVDDDVYFPHLALARSNRSRMDNDIVARINKMPELRWTCDELVLMKSVIQKGGAVHTPLI